MLRPARGLIVDLRRHAAGVHERALHLADLLEGDELVVFASQEEDVLVDAPRDLGKREWCERLDAPANVVTFARADLERPQRSSDAHLATLLERHARLLHDRLPARESFAAAVRHALADLLTTGHTDLAATAAKLRVSGRTLQRRLSAEGTTHRSVLDELRRDLALRYLEAGDAGLQEIAFVLGFSDQSTFHHAFVRWTGHTPGAWRRRASG